MKGNILLEKYFNEYLKIDPLFSIIVNNKGDKNIYTDYYSNEYIDKYTNIYVNKLYFYINNKNLFENFIIKVKFIKYLSFGIFYNQEIKENILPNSLTHLKFNNDADITHGLHCGYISPIPYLSFNDVLTENDFRLFIEALSNDIITWDKMKQVTINQKGVTYSDEDILTNQHAYEVIEANGMKFISGANLCFNLTNYKKIPPF